VAASLHGEPVEHDVVGAEAVGTHTNAVLPGAEDRDVLDHHAREPGPPRVVEVHAVALGVEHEVVRDPSGARDLDAPVRLEHDVVLDHDLRDPVLDVDPVVLRVQAVPAVVHQVVDDLDARVGVQILPLGAADVDALAALVEHVVVADHER
jgi:hypothetical protein